MEKRAWQPLGKKTAKEQRMCCGGKESLEQYSKVCTQRVGQSDANHCRSIFQWTQWSDVNSQALSRVPEKYYGMDYAHTAHPYSVSSSED